MKVNPMIKDKILIGWGEWCALPGLGVPAIKAKIDTGAKTSSIHAFNIEPKTVRGKEYVHFNIHPLQRNDAVIVACKAPIIDRRLVMSSNGHKEHRFVIATILELAGQDWEIEITLSNRDPLTFRMLLGREALNGRVLIDPSHSLRHGNLTKKHLNSLY
jgi:ribosomal protein S6--L-glutamate ligase